MVQTEETLKGKTVAVTRPAGQYEEAAEIIRRRGGKPYFIPTIEIKASTNLVSIEQFIGDLWRRKFDYVILMSTNGVKQLLNAAATLTLLNKLRRGLARTVVLAVGPRTARELEVSKIRVDLIPQTYTSEGIVETLQQHGILGKSVCIPRTSSAAPSLKEQLTKMGASVQEVYVYESALPADSQVAEEFFRKLAEGRIDAVVFGSSMCVRNLFQMLGKQAAPDKLRAIFNQKTTIVAIGPVTANTLVKMGLKVDVIPDRHVFEEALAKLAEFWATKN